jgi:transcriptional regulator with XRE-family HTH domain
MLTSPPPQTPTPPGSIAAWVNRRIGQEVIRRRTAIGLSAYALAKQIGLTDQSIRNIELGKCPAGSLSTSLARVAHRFGTTLGRFIDTAESHSD